MLTAGAVFSDHMVLQRGKAIPIWGKAAPLSEVCVSLDRQTVTGVSQQSGAWMVHLPATDTARGLQMTISCGDEKLEFSDISVGEVWFAGGQSNMELELINPCFLILPQFILQMMEDCLLLSFTILPIHGKHLKG